MLDAKKYHLATQKLKAKMSAFDGYYDNAHYSLSDMVVLIRRVMLDDVVRKTFAKYLNSPW